MRLFTFSTFPPGEFVYSQVWNGKNYTFTGDGLDIYTQAKRILSFRRANGIPRATLDECVTDINEFTCARLGNDPRFCGTGSRSQYPAQRVQQRGCGGCGASLKL